MRGAAYLAAVVSVLASSSAAAQQGQPGAHFIENWDLNEDGQVTLEEAREKRGDLFLMFDQDENGKLDEIEYSLFDETRQADMAENAGGHKKGMMKNVNKGMMRQFNDKDGDGLVSNEEFVSRTEKWLEMMDRSGDGVVTTDDFGKKGG